MTVQGQKVAAQSSQVVRPTCLVRVLACYPSSFASACKEFGETLQLSGSKEGLKFQVKGDIGSGNVLLKPRESEKSEDGQLMAACCSSRE